MAFESMYIGASGMKAHGVRVNNLGNNLANISTIGFKNSRVRFDTLISDEVTTGGTGTGFSQVGQGVRVASVLTDFSQGALEPGAEATDLAIEGQGFFNVVKDDVSRYTRAGNFRFDKDGYLVNPHGYVLQGMEITNGVAGSVGDIQLHLNGDGLFIVEPEATTLVSMVANLGSVYDSNVDENNPFFSMFKDWNGLTEEDEPLPESAYSFKNTIQVYDEDGGEHTLSVYFDPVTLSDAGGTQYWEYVVGMDPSEEGRAAFQDTSGAGLLMAGTMAFGPSGQLENISAFTYNGTGGVKDLDSWDPSAFSADGLPVFSATFSGTGSGAGTATNTIALNFGLENTAGSWLAGNASNAGAVGVDHSSLPEFATVDRGAFASSAYAGSSSVMYQSQDGSPKGYLQNISVDNYGVMVGSFSNGVNRDLFQLTLYNFPNEFGLRREGHNLFSESPTSGDASEATPNSEGLGAISCRTLEISNVDMATEFTTMISAQHGFQANSKVITATDQILQNLINLKR
ncbi:MAG: flagellar hook-basal body complex protein [Thermodesulfobacteriota bacterium]|nr:flagellar hook-basal body complex protein [Thermodesulfobacteriota bacterium]